MSQLILSINAGSSSLKTTLYQTSHGTKLRSLAKAEISAITQPPAKLKYSQRKNQTSKRLDEVGDHRTALDYILNAFIDDPKLYELKSRGDLQYACHRVVHGGDFTANQVINTETFHKIKALSSLAPLHNAAAVQLITACRDLLPDVTNVACFDSAFHCTMPEHVKAYAIDQKVAKDKGLRKYGFHGLSYAYITHRIADYLHQPLCETSIIALHLGSGASACAINQGKSIDTTMGLTPVSGLPGGTRSGDIDPSLVFHYTSEASKLDPASTKDLHISTAEEILNKKSGWKALTGTSDFSEIAKADAPNTHKLALDLFVDRIVGHIGNYYVKLGGRVDALVFAGGIGEKSAYLRRLVVERCACLGFTIDDEKNNNQELGQDGEEEEEETTTITEIGSTVVEPEKGRRQWTLICRTDEDYEMACSTMRHANN